MKDDKKELIFELMFKQEINLIDYVEFVFKNKVKNPQYTVAFMDEYKRRLMNEKNTTSN